MTKVFPWVCTSCGNKWVDNLFVTWGNCPECEGESLHESVRELKDDDEWYTEI